MTTVKKLEKKGYKVTYNLGTNDSGEKCIVSVTATNKIGGKYTDKNITAVNNRLTKKAF